MNMDSITINKHNNVVLFGDCAIHISCKNIPHIAAFGLTNWLSIASFETTEFHKLTDLTIQGQQLSKYTKRVLTLNANKKIIDYIFQNKADYFIFDCADCRKQILVQNLADGTKSYLTYSESIKKLINNNQYSLPEYITIQNSYDINIKYYLLVADMLCNKILEKYPTERIIFIIRKPVDYYFNDDGIHRIWRGETDVNESSFKLVSVIENYIISKLSTFGKINIIRFPDNVLADSKHHLGLYPLHYHNAYYDYLSKCINAIISNPFNSRQFTDLLYENYSLKFEKIKSDIQFSKNICYLNEFNNFLVNCSYSDFLKKININSELINNIRETSSFNNYLDILYMLRFRIVIIITVKDTCGFYSDNNLLIKVKRLSFKNYPSKLQFVYMGICIEAKNVLDECGKPKDKLHYSYSFLNKNIDITSSSYVNENTSQIIINGLDYSLNNRGINMVILNSVNGDIIDSISYDSHLMDYLKHKKIALI